MNIRLTVTAAVAVILASVSVYPLIESAGWFWAGVGAVIVTAVAGVITRLPTVHAAVGGSVIALIAVGSLLASPVWGLKVAGLVIVAITALSRPRVRILQIAAALITYLGALLIYVNAVFASRLSTLGVVPTHASLSYLSSLVSQGMGERIYAPPVPSTSGVMLLAAGGIGLMAVATDVLAVRLRSPAIAGLPLLALYCVRITTSAKQGGVGATVVFCLGMIGYLALLAADGRERLRIWGRLVTVWQAQAADPAEVPDTRALAASGRRIGLAAACIALAFPLLVPGISVHDLFKSQPTGNGQNGNLIAPPNPLDQMRSQLLSASPQTVLTYRTTAPDPREQYLQVYALNWDPGNEAWSLIVPDPTASTPVGSGPLRTAPGVTASTPRTETTTQVTLALGSTGYDAKLGFLPVPYAPAQMQVPGNWDEDNATLMLYSTQPQLSGLSYTVKSQEVNPEPGEENQSASYPAAISGNYLSFPAGPGHLLAKLAAQITKGATTPYRKALALQDYFQSGKFTYSTSVSLPPGIAGLIQFLTKSRSGYCQQFAFAMAGLARLSGIPSRIAVGYTAGTHEARGATWKVTSSDAHAWPELYFRGMGWVRFEPTPGGATGQGTAAVPQYASTPGAPGVAAPLPATGQNPGSKAGSKSGKGALSHIHGLNGGGFGGTTATVTTASSVVPEVLLVIAGILVLALLTPLTVRSLTRRYRLPPAVGGPPARLLGRWLPGASGDAGLAHAAWRELRDDLADYGHPCRPSESPRAVASRVTATLRLDADGRQALERIVRAEERARYARVPLSAQTLPADAAGIRRALAREADWPTRWRARLFPASTIALIRTGVQQALDVFGWMDAAGMRLRNSIRRQE
jgi:transglutaminase-like putative cysteine protease